MQDGMDAGRNETWSGVMLKDEKTAAAFSDAFWPVAKKEAEGLCRTKEGAANLARLVLNEMRQEYAEQPLPNDTSIQVVVKTCMLFGKWGYNEKQLAARVEQLRSERGSDLRKAPAAGVQDSEAPGTTEDKPLRQERKAAPAEEELSPQEERPRTYARAQRPIVRETVPDGTERVYRNPGTVRPSGTDRNFPQLYESPQIQINFMSPDWQGSKPTVQYVYPNAKPSETGTVHQQPVQGTPQQPSAGFDTRIQPDYVPRQASAENRAAAEPVQVSPAKEPGTNESAEAKQSAEPEKDAKKRPFRKEKKPKAVKAEKEPGSRLLIGFMIAAAVAAIASLGFLFWQLFFVK